MSQTVATDNRERLKSLLLDIFLMEPDEFSFDLRREQVETWDSLAIVAVSVGIEETFGYHMSQEEAMSVQSVPDIMRLLEQKGIPFDD